MNDELFTPGASLDAPTGDTERQAISSLGGYAYQVAVSALAWLDLPEDGRIFLEVAEDYATVATQALGAVQIKDTAGSGAITLNTASVRDAVDSFIDLVARNPTRVVELRYFTTSPIGTEHRIEDRPAGRPGLVYWRKAAAGGDVEPLRAILSSDKFSARVREFVTARDNDALRLDLLQKIHWDYSKPDLSVVESELQQRLLVLGKERFHVPSSESRRLADILMHHVLKKSILKNPEDRVLDRAELYATIDAATRISMPRAAVDELARLTTVLSATLIDENAPGPAFSVADVGWLVASSDLPAARATIVRTELEARVEGTLGNHGAAVLVGGSGLGKSLIARAVAQHRADGFVIVDLRDLDAIETRGRLDFVFARVGAIGASVIIFEDLNHFEDSSVTLSLARVLSALNRRDRVAVITSYRRPSDRALIETGLDAGVVAGVPYFSEAEADEVVQASGGAADTWGRIAYVVGAQGHPQLVHAFVMGMAARGWPVSELRDVVVRGLSSDEIDATREAARRSLAAALPEGARDLLYRLSLAIGRFDRALALTIGALPPAIPRAGEILDSLVGPWIEAVGRNVYRVSPLAGHSGVASLTEDEQRAVHNAIANQMTAQRTINASDANMILLHALAGKAEQSLVAMAHGVITAEHETLDLLSEHFVSLRLLRTDTPIYPQNPAVSRMLRLAQFRLVAAGEEKSGISECVAALLTEASTEQDARLRNLFEVLALSSVLITVGIADHISNWFALLQRFRALVESVPSLGELKHAVESGPDYEGVNMYGILFAVGATGISSVQRLEEVIADLSALDSDERMMWLEGYQTSLSDFGIFVNGPWSAEDKRDAVKPTDAAGRYKRMAERTKDWGIRPLTVQMHVARAVMLDEYANDKDGALKALDEAESVLGYDIGLERARAKIHWRADDHVTAIKILHRIAGQFGHDNPVERAFFMREAAISAAKTNDWEQAEKWFLEGQVAAMSSEGDDMRAMAIGLGADAAAAALNVGSVDRTLKGLAEALTALGRLNADATLRTAYCHRVVRHTVLWAQSQIEGNDTMIGGKPISVLPGTCSNPDPLPAIRDRPLAPIDFAWYMLAEAEIASGIEVGILASLRENLTQGPVPVLEFGVRNHLLRRDIQDLDHFSFAKHLFGFVEGMAFLRAEGSALRDNWEALNPPRGDMPPLERNTEIDAWAEPVAADAILAFCLSAALLGRPEKIDTLAEALSAALGSGYLGESVFSHWRGNSQTLGELDRVIADSVAKLNGGRHIDPSEVWGIGLRLFEKSGQSPFKQLLTPRIAEWLRANWQRIIFQESFRLYRPSQTVPPIKAVLAKEHNDESFVAALLLAAGDAVGTNLSTAYRDHLKALAGEAASRPHS